MGVKECRGGWGGEKREERKIYNRIAWLLKGKTTPSILFFPHYSSSNCIRKRKKRGRPHIH